MNDYEMGCHGGRERWGWGCDVGVRCTSGRRGRSVGVGGNWGGRWIGRYTSGRRCGSRGVLVVVGADGVVRVVVGAGGIVGVVVGAGAVVRVVVGAGGVVIVVGAVTVS